MFKPISNNINKDRGIKKIGSNFIVYGLLVAASLIVIIPIIVVLFASFKTGDEYARTAPFRFPENILNMENFKRAFIEGNMLRGFANTFLTMVISLSGAVIFGAMVAYVIGRFEFKGRAIILALFLLATMIPSVTTQVATFKIVNALRLYNTRWAGIILFTGTDIISIYIFLQFIQSLSPSLDESAMLEGASYITIFFRIIMPMLKPAITTVLIIKGVDIYNNFYTPFLYMPKRSLQMVSSALYAFKGPYGSQWEVICAAVVLSTLPTLIMFLSLQKYIYNGFSGGAVK